MVTESSIQGIERVLREADWEYNVFTRCWHSTLPNSQMKTISDEQVVEMAALLDKAESARP